MFYCSKNDFGFVLGADKDDTYTVHNIFTLLRLHNPINELRYIKYSDIHSCMFHRF